MAAIIAMLGIVGLCLASSDAHAAAPSMSACVFQDDDPKESDELDTAGSLSKLRADLRAEVKRLGKEYRAAETTEDRDEVVKRRRKMEVEIVDKAIALIMESDDAAINLSTISDMIPRVRGNARIKLFDCAIEKFGDSGVMTKVIESVTSGVPMPDDHKFLETIASQSTNESVKAAATFAQADLANSVRSLSEEQRSMYLDRFGDAFDHYCDRWNSDAGEKKLLALLEACETKFANAKFRGTEIGTLAGNMRIKMNLVVGKVVPDIIGEDLDGEPFKLSDYRGKVVMVDFWGDW